VLTNDDAANLRTAYNAHLEDQLSKVGSYVPTASMLREQWCGMVWPASGEASRNPDTGVEIDVLRRVGRASVTVPEGFVSSVVFYISNKF
jgi:probable 2-oxoglutarate dehydrogenase E1 component DHKTD1